MSADARARYLGWQADHEAARTRAHGLSVRIGTVRVATFLALAAALVVMDVQEGMVETAALALSIGLALAFVGEISIHRRVRRRERWHAALRDLAREGVLRLDRRWSELGAALPAVEGRRDEVPREHPWARDLDVVGEASLLRLLGPVTSERGRSILREWLLRPMDVPGARERQGAVRELAPEAELRAKLAAHGRLDDAPSPAAVEPFLSWAERAPWLPRWARVAAWVLPAALIGLVAGDYFLGWPPYWILVALVQVDVLRRVWRPVNGELRTVEEGGIPMRAYVPQIELIEDARWADPCLRSLTDRFRGSGAPASDELRRLSRLLDTVESRRNMVYATLGPLLLLDLHLAAALDRWRRRSGASARVWLDALGTWEALSALATTAHDHPDWCFPHFAEEEGPPAVWAVALGHPLLSPGRCVRNDVELGPPGTFLLVTGSNMSGKSTLLRAIGANVVLAGAGGPACAASMVLPALRVRTTMRVEDSVTEGVSLFMAELLRIRQVVTAVDDEAAGPPVLYLLDEILHGTNTAERRVAARAVIRHLLARGAIGAVSTHDLTLAEAPDLETAAVAVNFREQVVPGPDGGTRLTFDYQLRSGLATTRNALRLLAAVGLGDLEGLDDEVDGPDGSAAEA